MLDHVSIAVADLSRSLAFYEQALKPLGIKRLMAYGGTEELPDHVGFGDQQKPYFWLGRGEPMRGYVHVAFAAPSRACIDAFYRAALDAGGRDNGPPGLRPQYHPGYYGAFVFDPDGCNVEAVHHSF
jgi:catechol 2,3-dioxygenase-like lactoylglutathione lyase family enzyme